MKELIITALQTAGMVVAACVLVDFVIIRMVKVGKIRLMRRQKS